QQPIARNIFLRLTELGEGTQDTRRRATLAELIPQAKAKPEVETVLKVLADARLVATGQESVEVAHEALIREWPLLRHWLDENRDSLRLHRRLSKAAQEWEQNRQDPAFLYLGNRLTPVAEWAAGVDDLNDLERAFLEASLAEQERLNQVERTREKQAAHRRRYVAIAALVVIAVLSGLTWWAFGQRNEAITAKSEVAQQLAVAQAELDFSQTFDSGERVAHLVTLFELQGGQPGKLFWDLTEAEQLDLFTVKNERLPVVIKGLYMSLGDVNQSGYTDPLLAKMVEVLESFGQTDDIETLRTELDKWRQGREEVRQAAQSKAKTRLTGVNNRLVEAVTGTSAEKNVGDEAIALYKEAITFYDEAIALNGANPATRYEKAAILIELADYEAALVELNQVVTLAHKPDIALSQSGEVKADFATREQVVQAAKRLIKLDPELGQVLNGSSSTYSDLQQAGLVIAPTPTPITAPDGGQM
ncbi:MAG: hypothetical protein GY792_11855, partial [Gammaproteobacteria bacterium]|nr:hypothetical protein [Gammaproteobacteria bacterium]